VNIRSRPWLSIMLAVILAVNRRNMFGH
jgi:hypothetical protein